MTTIHIVTAASLDYVPHAAAMLHSVFENNPGQPFAIHLLHRQGQDGAEQRRLDELCRRHGAVFTAIEVRRALLEGLPITGRYPEEAWYRLLLPRLLPDLDRVLWLDADVITLSALGELWSLALEGAPLAACPNAVLFAYAGVLRNIGIENRSRYFNTGVVLLDLRRMREEQSEQALLAAARQHRESIRFADQDVLNVVYHLRYKPLPLAWNVLTQTYINVPESIRVHGVDNYKAAIRAPRIIHFTGSAATKPWNFRCGHPYRDAYLRHRALAGWPPPQYADRSLRNSIARKLPLRLRAILSTLRHRRYAEALSYLRAW